MAYCEENIYRLSQHHPLGYIVFISNDANAVPFYKNKNNTQLLQHGEDSDGLVVWDYHVILVRDQLVYDFDSSVAFPCPLDHYLSTVLKVQVTPFFEAQYRRLYRIIKAADYRREFASDRSHMKVADGDGGGGYISPVPNFEAIVSDTGVTMNLHELIRVTKADVSRYVKGMEVRGLHGVVLEEEDLIRFMKEMKEDSERDGGRGVNHPGDSIEADVGRDMRDKKVERS